MLRIGNPELQKDKIKQLSCLYPAQNVCAHAYKHIDTVYAK